MIDSRTLLLCLVFVFAVYVTFSLSVIFMLDRKLSKCEEISRFSLSIVASLVRRIIIDEPDDGKDGSNG